MTASAAPASERIFLAIDTADAGTAGDFATRVGGAVGGIKLGLEYFLANGPTAIRGVAAKRKLFLDLKLHDIPNTVAGGVRAVAPLAPYYLTVMAAGGPEMIRRAVAAAREGAERHGVAPARILAVTVLTSLGEDDLERTGQRGPAAEQVLRLATMAQACGAAGAVCSPQEVELLRRECGAGFALVVPGVRPVWAPADDQKRVMTPAEAVNAGADHLVIGRPILRAADPADAARRIAAEIDEHRAAAA